MFEPLLILSVLLIYIGLLFALAQWASRRAQKQHPLVYSLSIAVYCTSWTFYGSVGSAANNGILFLAVYLLFFLIIGCVFDTLAAMIILTPILLPVTDLMGIDRIHFGVITTYVLMLGILTPPLGIALCDGEKL